MNEDRLTVIHPTTGELVDLHDLDDLALGLLLDDHYEIERKSRTNVRVIRGEMRRRASERVYDDGKRRMFGKWSRTQTIIEEQVQEGVHN